MQQGRELQCKPFPRLQLFRDSCSCHDSPWPQLLQEISSCYGMGPSLGSKVSLVASYGHSCCTPKPCRTFSQTGEEHSCSWERFFTWIQLPGKTGTRGVWLGTCGLGSCSSSCPLLQTERRCSFVAEWKSTTSERGEELGSTEKKEVILNCGCSYRLQKCHKSVHFYDFFTPNWAQLHTQGQPSLIYFKLTQHQSEIPYYTKLFSLSYLPQTIKLNKWMNIIHSLVYEPEAPQRQ